MNRNKIIFYSIWTILFLLGPLTILKGLPNETLENTAQIMNLAQRLIGLITLCLLFFQLILGSLMDFWVQKLGAWVFKFHVREGIAIYLLILAHTFSFLAFNFFVGRGFDPFYIFTQFCILCPNTTEIYYTLGRLSFWFLTAGVFAGLFRAATPFMQLHWRKFHYLNYAAFFLIWIHSFGVGSDIGSFPYNLFHGPSLVVISGLLLYRISKGRGN